MADNLTTQTSALSTVPNSSTIATDDISGVHYQKIKIALGVDGAIDSLLDSGQQLSANSLPVVLSSDHGDIAVTLDGEGVSISGTVQVQSNSANLATEATAQAIQTAVEIIDNAVSGSEMQTDIVTIAAGASADIGSTTDAEASGNGSVIAVLKRLRTLLSGTITVSNSAFTTADLDTGAGTDTRGVVGIALAESGGSVNVGSANPLPVDASGNAVPVTDNGGSLTVDGTVTANLSATDNAVLDQIEVNTSYGDNTGGGTETGALRVTLANDSTGVLSVDDNGGSLTVDGTVTANLSATDNAVLDQIETNTDFGTVSGGGTETGALRVTLANNSTGLISVDDNEGSLTVDNGGTFAVQVDAALPAGTNAIGKLSENDGVDIGDVDVTSVTPGTGASNLGKAEDSGHTSGDVGVMALGVRQDSGGAIAGADGDYTPFQVDSSGNLRVNVAAGAASGTEYTEDDAAAANPSGPANLLVRQDTPAGVVSTDGDMVAQRATNYGAAYVQILDSSGNFVNSFGGSGGTSHADDAAFSIGSASSITPTGYLADETTPDSVDEGDVGVPRMTLSRKPYAVITDATSENNAAVDGSGHLQVDIAADSVGIGGGTQYTEDDAAAANPVGNINMAVRADSLGAVTSTDGDNIALRATNNGELYVKQTDAVPVTDNGGSLTVDNGGTFAVQAAQSGSWNVGTVTTITNDVNIADGGNSITVDDGGGALTVDGTVTANLSATDNAVLDQIEVNTSYGDNTGGGTETGALRVTLANDSTGVLTVDDGDSSLTVDNGGTFAVQVDAALPTGDNSVGRVKITDGTEVANVNTNNRLEISIEEDNVGIGGGTEYNVNDATPANPTGKAVLMERDDTLSTLTEVAGDWTNLRSNARGALWVELDPTNDVAISDGGNVISVDDGGASLTVDGTVTANLSATDNAVLDSIDTNTTYGLTTGGGTETGALRVTLANNSTGVLSVDDNGGSLTVDNADLSTIAGAVTGTEMQVDIVTSALPTGAATAANQSTANGTLSTIESNTDYGQATGGGVEANALRVTLANDSTGVLTVDDGGSTLSIDDGGGTITVDGTVTASSTTGNVAHDAADSGNPVKVGHKAKNFDGSAPGSAVAENDRVDSIADVYGRQYVETTHPNYWHATGNYSGAQTDASVKAAPGAGLKLYITDVVLTTDTAMNIQLEHGTTDVIPPMYFAANGGAAMHFQTPIVCAANTALTITSSAAGNHSVLVSGYTAA
jgi:hypothetical protein